MTAILDEVATQSLPCHQVDPEVFFAESPTEVEFAKSLCQPCPLKDLCLAAALDREEAAGVWGGELLVNGAIVARKRGRGRPRKNPLPAESVPARTVAANPLFGSRVVRQRAA